MKAGSCCFLSFSSLLLVSAWLLLLFGGAAAADVGDDECSTAKSCLDCSKMATCAWCASREPDFHGTCTTLADARTGCDQEDYFIVTSTSDKYTQECCSFQTDSCAECLASGGAWGEMVEAINGNVHSRCWTQSGCQAEMLSFEFVGGDKYNIRASACYSSSCDGVKNPKRLFTDGSPSPPIAFTFPEDDHCASSKSCLGCERTAGNDDCRWCFPEWGIHAGACIGTGKGIGTEDSCPPRSHARYGDADLCSVQAPTCELCATSDGVWGVMYYLYQGDPKDPRVVRRCFSNASDCSNALDNSDNLEGSNLSRLCSPVCSKFSSTELEATDYYKKKSGGASSVAAAAATALALTVIIAANLF